MPDPQTEAEKAAAEKAAAEKAAADKLTADKAEAEKKGALAAATSIGDAVKRVTDAVVADINKVKAAPAQDFQFAGGKQGRFEIRGDGFSTNGTVKVNGQQATTTEWGNERIVGKMPDNVKAGQVAVEVAIDKNTVQRGTFAV